MTLGQCQCMVPYAIHFTTQHSTCVFIVCVLVFFFIFVVCGIAQVSHKIKPLAKRGSQHRCTGQLALQKHAAGWCHWGDGSVDLFPRFQVILVFKKFEELAYVGVLGGFKVEDPLAKGIHFFGSSITQICLPMFGFHVSSNIFQSRFGFVLVKKNKKNKFDQI